MENYKVSTRQITVVLVLLAYGIFCLLVLRTAVQFPMTLDQRYFLPASYYFSQTGLIHNAWNNPIQTTVLNWHGFLQPAVVSYLAIGGTWTGIFFGLNLLAFFCLSLVAAGTFILRLSVHQAAAILIITLGLLLDYRARPETLAAILTVSLVLLGHWQGEQFFRRPTAAIASGIIFALLFCAHPAIFLLSAILFAGYAPILLGRGEASVGDLMLFSVLLIAAILPTLLLTFYVIYGHDPAVYIEGILAHARKTSLRTDTNGLFKIYVMNRFVPAMGLAFVFFIPIGAVVIQGIRANTADHRRHLWSMVSVLFALLFLASLYHLAIRIPHTYYNFSGLMPALMLTAAGAFRHKVCSTNSLRLGRPVIWIGLVAACLFGQLLWLYQNISEFKSATANRSAIEAIVQEELQTQEKVCVDMAALIAFSDFATTQAVHFFDPQSGEGDSPSPADCTTVIRVAADADDIAAPRLSDFHLIADHFTTNYATPLGIRPLNLRYAVYQAKLQE